MCPPVTRTSLQLSLLLGFMMASFLTVGLCIGYYERNVQPAIATLSLQLTEYYDGTVQPRIDKLKALDSFFGLTSMFVNQSAFAVVGVVVFAALGGFL
jgi:hypothetical protein